MFSQETIEIIIKNSTILETIDTTVSQRILIRKVLLSEVLWRFTLSKVRNSKRIRRGQTKAFLRIRR